MTEYEKKSLQMLETILNVQQTIVEMISKLPSGTGNRVRAASAKRSITRTKRATKKSDKD